MGIIVDSFAGGGGASHGIFMALGRHPDIAVNHDIEAVLMHEANHPSTRHFCGDIWGLNPRHAVGGKPVDLLWASPDCTHHSKAKGGKPLDNKRRGLAWVVIRWAKEVRPLVICLENVEEWKDWGPLDDALRPDPARKGLTFRRWMGQLKAQGYEVEMRELRACDYGAPTTRKRLFVIARCDGQPIVWPEPTHGPGLEPYRTAADCIDWSIPCPSIFDRKKPLAEPTLRRIARGLRRFVLESSNPFIVNDVAPTLVQTGYGERKGQAPRSLDLQAPIGTIVACGAKHALVSAFLAKHYGGHEGSGSDLHQPMATVTTRDHHALVQAFLVKYYGTSTGQAVDAPIGTLTTNQHFALVKVRGEQYRIADIGMRMLSPRELFRAQGFPDSYIIDPLINGMTPSKLKTLSKSSQIRMCGNSVSPPVAAAIVAANCGHAMQVAA